MIGDLGIADKILFGIFIGILFSVVFLSVPEAFATYKSAPAYVSELMADCENFGGDQDGDAICDDWEPGVDGQPMNLVVNFPGEPSYTYKCGPNTDDPVCPRKDHKDVFLEIDFMQGHYPDPQAIEMVKNSFASVPNSEFKIPNPDGQDGINLHVQVDEMALPFETYTLFPGYDFYPPYWGFAQAKKIHFGTPNERESNWDWRAKQQVFHYALFVHNQWGTSSSGIAEGGPGVAGNDLMISLGSFAGGVGSTEEQAGTLMHELGHNLGLDHGGFDKINCKPNYLSVMSHSRQMPILVTDRDLDYSLEVLGEMDPGNPDQLSEGTLKESLGIKASSDPQNTRTVYGPEPPLTEEVGQCFDWNRDGDCNDEASSDINNFIIISGIADCPSTYSNPSNTEILKGHDDWNTIKFEFRDNVNYASGGLGSGKGTGDYKLTGKMPLTVEDILKKYPAIDHKKAKITQAISSVEYTGSEFTREMAINQHVSRIDALEYIIGKALKGTSYTPDKGQFDKIRDLINQEKFKEATKNLEQLKTKFTNKEILNEIDDIILSHTKATQFTPTDVFTKYGQAKCDEVEVMKLKTGMIQLPYCIVNGKLVSGSINEDKKALVLEIAPTSDGQITIMAPKNLLGSKPLSQISVTSGGKSLKFHDKFSDSAHLALTIDFMKTTSSLEIMATDFVPTPTVLLSPKKLISAGITADEISCNEGLELILRDGTSPSCVQPLSAIKLVERGWGTKP